MNISKKSSTRSTLTMVILGSIVLHLIAGVLFGTFKIVQSITREEQTFEAPPIEEVPQQEPEYVVNLEQRNQSSAPPRPNPIVVDTPDVSIPALNIDVNVANASVYGRGSGGLGGGGSIREMALDLTNFGYTGKIAGTLEGILVDLKRDEDGKPTGLGTNNRKKDGAEAQSIIKRFTSGQWRRRDLENDYYVVDQRLYASYWIVPNTDAEAAPEAFGVAGEVEPMFLLAHYEGEFKPTENMRIRFVGLGDDVLVVRLENNVVFDGSWSLRNYSNHSATEVLEIDSYFGGFDVSPRVGPWFDLRRGFSYELQVLVGEVPGGEFGFYLLYQVEGESGYRIFTTKPLTAQEENFLKKLHKDTTRFL